MNELISLFPIKNICIDKVFVYGGYLTKSSHNDIDLLIISNDFEGMSRLKRIEKVTLNFNSQKIDPVCLSANEYERLIKTQSIFLKMILSNAHIVYERESY